MDYSNLDRKLDEVTDKSIQLIDQTIDKSIPKIENLLDRFSSWLSTKLVADDTKHSK